MDYDKVSGTGQFVFFLHGWGGDKNSFKIARAPLEALSRNMVFVSFSGAGESPEPERPFFVSDFVDELRELIIKEAKGRSVDIVCHSFGARVAVKLAAKYPKLVDSLIIVDGAGVKPRRSLSYYLRVFQYKRAKKKVKRGKLPPSVLEKFGSSDYKQLSPVMKQTFINVVNEDLKPDIKKVKAKTLIFWGDKDRETPLYMAKKMKRWIKNSRLVISKGSGHFSYIDDFELFYYEMLKFLED